MLGLVPHRILAAIKGSSKETGRDFCVHKGSGGVAKEIKETLSASHWLSLKTLFQLLHIGLKFTTVSASCMRVGLICSFDTILI